MITPLVSFMFAAAIGVSAVSEFSISTTDRALSVTTFSSASTTESLSAEHNSRKPGKSKKYNKKMNKQMKKRKHH